MRTKFLAFLSAFLVASVALAGPWDDIIKYGYATSGGPLTGAVGFAVCEQVDDDTTPSIGTPPASLPSGCNVLLTSTNHGGAITITRFDDAESGVEPVTSTLYEQILWVVGRGATNQTTIADGANFRLKEISWDSPATGDHSVIQFKATYLTSTITAVGDGGSGTSLDITSATHGLVIGQTVTLSSMSVVAYDGTYVINTVADANTFNVTQAYSATATGTWDAVRFDEMWRSGNVDDYFYQQIFVNQGNITDFPNTQMVVGHSDTGDTSNDRIGFVAEATADGTNESRGLQGIGTTSSAKDGTGILGIGHVAASADATTAYGSLTAASDTHAGGPNISSYCTASGGATNYCLQFGAGDINSLAAINWLMLDATVASVSWDAAGAANILSISSADGEETVSHVSKFTGSSALDAASGDEYAWDLAYETNKATSGDDYGMRIRQTDTDSPVTSYLLDIGVATSSQWNVTNTGIMTLYGSSWTDALQMYHDETDVYFRTLDGNFIFQTDEGTNTATAMELKPKGTSEITSLGLYDTDGQRAYFYTAADRAYIETQGGALGLQNTQVQNVLLWEGIASGNPSLIVYGWNSAGSDRESTSLIMDDANDEFLIQSANSVNHEGITIDLLEGNQRFRLRQASDVFDVQLDGSDAFAKWSDGNLILMTDEGTNTVTAVEFKPKGTSEVSTLGLYDTDSRELWLHTDANRGYLDSGTGALGLQSNVVQDVLLWEAIGSGNPSLILSGWNTAGSDLESTELTMDDTNDEFLIRAANSANHEGITIELDEANQLFRVRGSDGAVDFSSSDTAALVVNPATFNSTIDAESYMAIGNGTALSGNKTLVIDRDFSDASDGEALSVTGSQIEVTAGTGDIHHTMMNPGSSTFSTATTLHGYASTLTLLEPNIVLQDGATLSHASTLRIVNAPSEGTTSNFALWIDDGHLQADSTFTAGGLITGQAGATISGAALDVQGQMITEGDGTYSWDHTPTGIATEGTSEFDGMLWADGGATIAGLTMSGDLDMADYDILNPSQLYQEAITADTTPGDDLDILAGNAYSEATGGNRVGGSANVAAGIGTRQVTIDDFNNCALDTVTSTNDGVDCVCTEADGGGANKWDAVTDNATSATNLAVCLDACPGASASATAAVVYIVPDPDDTFSVALAEGDPTCTTLTQGADGSVVLHTGYAALTIGPTAIDLNLPIDMNGNLVGDSSDAVEIGTACSSGVSGQSCHGDTAYFDGVNAVVIALTNDQATPSLAFGDGNTGFYEAADNDLRLSLNGGGRWQWTGGYVQGVIANGPFMSNVDGTNTVPSIGPDKADYDTGLGAAAADQLSGIAGAEEIWRAIEAGDAGNTLLVQGDSFNNGDTADGVIEVTATLNATEAAGGSDNFSAINVDVTTTDTTGWDQANLMRLREDSADRFRVSMIGDVTAEGGYGGDSFQNTVVGATATFGSVSTATAAATGAADFGSGSNSNAGDFSSGNTSLTSGDTTDTDGTTGSVTVGSGAAAAGAADAGSLYLQTHDVARLTITGAGAVDVANALTAGTIASDTYVTGTYGTFTLGAAEKFFIDAATTEHTQTSGALDIDLIPTTDATGVVATDIHITAPALGIEATTHVGLNIQYTGDAQDEGASIVQLIQVGFQPNTSGTTVYGMYSNDNDLDYFIFNDGTSPSRFDGPLVTGGLRVKTPSGDTALGAAASLTVTHETMRVVGDGAARTLGDPNIVSPALDGTCVCLQGTSDANTVTVEDEGTNDGSEMELSGDVSFILGENDKICLTYDSGEDRWIEDYRSENSDAE